MTDAGKVERLRQALGAGVLVCVPCYRARERVGVCVGDILDVQPYAHVLVVDDGSPDGTGDVAAALAELDGRVFALRRSERGGVGEALREALAWGLERDYAVIVVFDREADAAFVPALVSALADAEVAVGSRRVVGGSGGRGPRAWLSRVGTRALRRATQTAILDPASSFLAVRAEAARSLVGLRSVGQGWFLEAITACERAGLRIVEVPVAQHPMGAVVKGPVEVIDVLAAAWRARSEARS